MGAQHLDDGKGVQYHGVGAGILIDPSMTHKGDVPSGSLRWHYKAGIAGVLEGAFAHASINTSGLVISHYSSGGKKLYEAPPVSPRFVAGADLRSDSLQV